MAEYYAPSAKKRWCLSSYDEVGRDALGILPHLTMVGFHSVAPFVDFCNL